MINEEAFKKIDSEICNSVNAVKELAKELQFLPVCEFLPGQSLTEESWNLMACPGIYLLEIKNRGMFSDFKTWADDFKTEWEKSDYIHKFVPNLKKKRLASHTDLKEWVPIYIGKSKWIGSRIRTHLYAELNKHTFSLKLSERQNLNQDKFRISIIPISVVNYDWVMPTIESVLRDKINPILGKQ